MVFCGVNTLFRRAALALALSVTAAGPASAATRIGNDDGGNIGSYYSRFVALRNTGEQVIIDGSCLSACTLVVALVPQERICVTAHASLGFHAAYRLSLLGEKVLNGPGTRTLMSLYPLRIREWIKERGGLTDQMMYLSGPQLGAMFRRCR